MNARARIILPIIAAVVIAAGCIRLGLWQLARLDERRAQNAVTRAQLAAEPISASELRGPNLAPYRRVALEGRYDFSNEMLLTSRTHRGAPGVNILTPLRLVGRDTAILVNRGWVYSPDGTTIDLDGWREADSASGTGYTLALSRDEGVGDIGSSSHPRAIRRLDPVGIAQRLPYPVAPVYIVLLEGAADSARRAQLEQSREATPGGPAPSGIPVRLQAAALDEGPHWSYAVQWFAFAFIAVAGVATLLWTQRRRAIVAAQTPH